MGVPLVSKPEVVIVGGGVIGCSIAYYLAQAGVKSQIIEKNAIGSEASGATRGLLCPAYARMAMQLRGADIPAAFIRLGLEGLSIFRSLQHELREQSGVDFNYVETPLLYPAFTEQDEIDLRQCEEDIKEELALNGRTEEFDISWIGEEDLKSLDTHLRPGARGALCCRGEAQVESYPLVLAYAQAAESQGARVQSGTVVGLQKHGSTVTGVILLDGRRVDADIVVLAMGPWIGYAGSWLGTLIPVVPLRSQHYRFSIEGKTFPYGLNYGPHSLLPKVDGSILASSYGLERVGFDNHVTEEKRLTTIKGAVSLAPSLTAATVTEGASGLVPYSADDLPYIGAMPGWDNVYVAAGHGGHGLLLSAVTGSIIADLITQGHTNTNITAFGPDRFQLR